MENFKLETRIELFKEVFSYLTQGEKEEQLFEMVACANSWDGSLEEYKTYSMDNSDEIIETVLSDDHICSQVDWLGDDLAENIANDNFDFSAGDKVMVESCSDGSVETVIKPVFNESEDEIFYQLSEGSEYPSDELSLI